MIRLVSTIGAELFLKIYHYEDSLPPCVSIVVAPTKFEIRTGGGH